ncbi:MAG: hypothetical protein RBU45_09525 [Myxococcota bacterium]|jgi:hypothetical protein|nr:hypothetical protein [Myxococcota bacterium]
MKTTKTDTCPTCRKRECPAGCPGETTATPKKAPKRKAPTPPLDPEPPAAVARKASPPAAAAPPCPAGVHTRTGGPAAPSSPREAPQADAFPLERRELDPEGYQQALREWLLLPEETRKKTTHPSNTWAPLAAARSLARFDAAFGRFADRVCLDGIRRERLELGLPELPDGDQVGELPAAALPLSSPSTSSSPTTWSTPSCSPVAPTRELPELPPRLPIGWRACRAILRTLGRADLWGPDGPTPEARAILAAHPWPEAPEEEGPTRARELQVALRAGLALAGEWGRCDLGELLALETAPARAVALALLSMAAVGEPDCLCPEEGDDETADAA